LILVQRLLEIIHEGVPLGHGDPQRLGRLVYEGPIYSWDLPVTQQIISIIKYLMPGGVTQWCALSTKGLVLKRESLMARAMNFLASGQGCSANGESPVAVHRASASLTPGEPQALQVFTPEVRRVAPRTRGVSLPRVLESLQVDHRGSTSTGAVRKCGRSARRSTPGSSTDFTVTIGDGKTLKRSESTAAAVSWIGTRTCPPMNRGLQGPPGTRLHTFGRRLARAKGSRLHRHYPD
jgi:hypothetical protein